MKLKINPTIEDRMDAVIARYRGMPYFDVLREFKLTPKEFMLAIGELSDFIDLTSGTGKQIFEVLVSDSKRRNELFNMGYDYIKEQYDRICGRIPGKKQVRFCDGTFFHPENIENIVYYSLTSNNPQLGSSVRSDVIGGIKKLPYNLRDYFYNIRLAGLMSVFKKGERNSPLIILKIFDCVYQKRTGDNSLFDLGEREHLHPWGDNFIAQKRFWRDYKNVRSAVYHILTENHHELASESRMEVTREIKNLPSNLSDYFFGIGLCSLMFRGLKKGDKGSPLVVLKIFDDVWQEKTGNKSLFDKTQEIYLETDGKNRVIRI